MSASSGDVDRYLGRVASRHPFVWGGSLVAVTTALASLSDVDPLVGTISGLGLLIATKYVARAILS